MYKQGQRRHSNKITITYPNIKLETIHLSFQPFFFYFLLILCPKMNTLYTPSTTKNLILIQFSTNCSNERHKNSHSAKQKQGKKALFWCAELDLTDRTHLCVQYTKTQQNEHPVLHVVCQLRSRRRATF